MDTIVQHSKIRDFLSFYPMESWNAIVLRLCLEGLNLIIKQYGNYPAIRLLINQEDHKRNTLKQELQTMKQKLDQLDEKLAKKQQNLLQDNILSSGKRSDREMRVSELKENSKGKKERSQSAQRHKNKNEERLLNIQVHNSPQKYVSSQKYENIEMKERKEKEKLKDLTQRKVRSPSLKEHGSSIERSQSHSIVYRSPSDTTIQIQDIERQISQKHAQKDKQKKSQKLKEASQRDKSKDKNFSISSKSNFPSKLTSIFPSKMTSPKAGAQSLIKNFVQKDKEVYKKQKELEKMRKEQELKEKSLNKSREKEVRMKHKQTQKETTNESAKFVKEPILNDLKQRQNKHQVYQDLQQETLSNLVNREKSYLLKTGSPLSNQNSPYFQQKFQQADTQYTLNTQQDQLQTQSTSDKINFKEKSFQMYQNFMNQMNDQSSDNTQQKLVQSQNLNSTPQGESQLSVTPSYNYSNSQEKVQLKDLDEIIKYFKQQQDTTSFHSILSGITSLVGSQQNVTDSISQRKVQTSNQFSMSHPYSLAMSISSKKNV